MTDTTKTPPMAKFAAMVKQGVAQEGEKVRVGFKEGSTTNKIAVMGGISSGVTFFIQGLRTLRAGLVRDEKTGKRDAATAALGIGEIAGGLFLTGLFYHNLRQGNDLLSGLTGMRAKSGGQGQSR